MKKTVTYLLPRTRHEYHALYG